MATCLFQVKLVAMSKIVHFGQSISHNRFHQNWVWTSISRSNVQCPRMNMIWCRTERDKIEKFVPRRTERMWFVYGHWLGSCNKFSLWTLKNIADMLQTTYSVLVGKFNWNFSILVCFCCSKLISQTINLMLSVHIFVFDSS